MEPDPGGGAGPREELLGRLVLCGVAQGRQRAASRCADVEARPPRMLISGELQPLSHGRLVQVVLLVGRLAVMAEVAVTASAFSVADITAASTCSAPNRLGILKVKQ